MTNASSTFLRGANAIGSGAVTSAVPDESSVLAAVGRPEVVDVSTLAGELGTNQQTVAPLVDQLVKSKLIDASGDGLKLSPEGERALRYMGMAKF